MKIQDYIDRHEQVYKQRIDQIKDCLSKKKTQAVNVNNFVESINASTGVFGSIAGSSIEGALEGGSTLTNKASININEYEKSLKQLSLKSHTFRSSSVNFAKDPAFNPRITNVTTRINSKVMSNITTPIVSPKGSPLNTLTVNKFLKKKLSLQTINTNYNERDLRLKEFEVHDRERKNFEIQRVNFENILKDNRISDDTLIYKNLRLVKPKIPLDPKIVQKKKLEVERSLDIRGQNLLKNLNNPSLGPTAVEKMYPDIFHKFKSLKNNSNKLTKNYKKYLFKNVLVARRTNVVQENNDNKYERAENTKFAQISKLKMKWKTMQWLIDNKKEILDKIISISDVIIKRIKLKSTSSFVGVNISEFSDIIISHGITNDQSLINKLFWIFDEDGSGDLRYEELAFGVEMFRNSSLEEKLKAFFDLCDIDKSGTISKDEFSNLILKNLVNIEEKISMKSIIDRIFKTVEISTGKKEMTFEQLIAAAAKNHRIYEIINKNFMALKEIDNLIDNDIKSDIVKFNPELNEELRMKILCVQKSYIPPRDAKIEKIIDGMVENNANYEKLSGFRNMKKNYLGELEEEYEEKVEKTRQEQELKSFDILRKMKPSKSETLLKRKTTIMDKFENYMDGE